MYAYHSLIMTWHSSWVFLFTMYILLSWWSVQSFCEKWSLKLWLYLYVFFERDIYLGLNVCVEVNRTLSVNSSDIQCLGYLNQCATYLLVKSWGVNISIFSSVSGKPLEFIVIVTMESASCEFYFISRVLLLLDSLS